MKKEMQNLKNRIIEMLVGQMVSIWRMDDKDKDVAIQRLARNMFISQESYQAAYDHFSCMVDLLTRMSKSRGLTPRERTLIAIFSYLIIAEGQICDAINFISYLLVTMGHDLYSFIRREYLRDDMEKIGKVEMSTKIQFLKHHGFGALVKEYDTSFRNNVAHHNYRVDEKGILWVRGKKVNLFSKLNSALRIPRLLNEAIDESNKGLKDLKRKIEKEVAKTR